MARPISLSTSGVSTSAVAPLCHFISPFSVSVNTVVTGTVTYSLHYTSNDVQGSGTITWKDHPLMTGATVGDLVEFTAPVTAVRINQTVGSGSIAAKVIQAGL